MPIPTPFHSRTAPLCESHEWRGWSGYLAAAMYEPAHEYEYYAIRNSAAMIDVSPLFKYEIRGPDAEKLVNRIMTRDVAKCVVGQVMYSPWCDDDGKVIDDGTISRLAPDAFRVTAADPSLVWFQDCGYGMQAEVVDVSNELAALALQGPNARKILKEVVTGIDLDAMRYYHFDQGSAAGLPVTVSRTGYTGDLGYELWVAAQNAGSLWDCLAEAGRGYGIAPAGMVALDIARIEAGLLLIEIDYISSRKALIESQKSSPFEIGLGWAVDLDKQEFVGRQALLAEKRQGTSKWQWVGFEVIWESLEGLYASEDLAPQVAGRASRSPVPVYQDGRQIGQVTSHTFSPILKKYIGLGTVQKPYAVPGSQAKADQVGMEFTVEYVRRQAQAHIVKTPFFSPARKRA
jgi:glycine cleavage system T protein (aminomethyltransferase)